MGDTFEQVQSLFSTYAGWVYILGVNFFLLFAVWLMFSKYGDVRLGGHDAKPEFSRWSWFAMLFSAGMGIGLVFWSVAEPMYHYASPPLRVAGETVEGAKMAMTITFFHWGFHAWSIYAVIALSLAFFSFNRGLPLTIRSAFYPLLGERIHGPIGHTIDILAVVATMFGLATSLGLGVQKVNAGLNTLMGVQSSTLVQVILIAVITLIAIGSVVEGLDKGVRRLSELNMLAAGALMIFLFVGMFIARVSKGRTVREFVLGVLMVPALLTALWLTVFGGTAIHQEPMGNGGIVEAVNADVATALYVLLGRFPLAEITSLVAVVAVVAVVTFFVTSSDSGSLVIDTITSGGHPNPPVQQKVFWATAEGVVAAALLVAGGLGALQAGSILTGLPFAIVLFFMALSLRKGLHEEWLEELSQELDEARAKKVT